MIALASLPTSLLAYALIWALFLAVPAARDVVAAQFKRFPAALRRRLWLGLACGIALVLVNGLILVLLGTYRPTEDWAVAGGALLLSLGWTIAVATTEEMILRGLLLTRIRQLAGDRVAVAVTAVIFAGMHVGRSDFSISSFVQYLADGLLLGWLVLRTGDIWAGTGFHFAKNFGVALLLGGSKHMVPPLLLRVPGSHAATEPADVASYAVAVALAVALFRGARATADRSEAQ